MPPVRPLAPAPVGEFLALAESLAHLGEHFDSCGARLRGCTLDEATGKLLEANKSPSRKVKQIDNRGSHFYLALYWAQALAKCEDAELRAYFEPIAKALSDNESKIVEELLAVQGRPVDVGGYYLPDDDLASKAMRPSPTLNAIIDAL